MEARSVKELEARSVKELEALKYPELRKLAKQAGVKANLKADRLLKALKKHFHPTSSPEHLSDDSDNNCTLSDKDELQSSQDNVETTSVSSVPQKRGRGKQKVQRKSIVTKKSPKNKETDQEIQTSPKHKEADQEIQTPKSEPVQETDEQAREKTTQLGSANQQKKRKRTEDDLPAQATETAANITKSETSNPTTAAPPGGKIPRYKGRLSKPGSKPSTPNFKKLHEAHFKKMESIDKYMERKQKRLDALGSSIQEVKALAKTSDLLTQVQKTPGSTSKSLFQSRFFVLSPAMDRGHMSPVKTPANQRRSARSSTAKGSILVNKSAPKPSAASGSRMNVRFSEATKDNEHKRSLIKTPSRKFSFIGTPGSEARRSSPVRKPNPHSDGNSSLPLPMADLESEANKGIPAATTPFKLTTPIIATPNTNNKSKFDLHASLAKPLGYQPHRGKLKPWGDTKENQPGQSSHVSMLKNSFKKPTLQTRDDRRKLHEEDRKLKRDRTIGKRRGIDVQ
ncbi:nucleolar and spindle-associated protein 1 [Hyperolius riggenbachi]|uniref:nucleolar and spindle-associated protein 1 n=1 Tax=Hyperolius riggenbachi TaxID=752182 RepID=UPI0035A284D5